MLDIGCNLDGVRCRIEEAEKRFNRPAGSVQLMAVSKTKPVALIEQAISFGQKCFGENYVQEMVDKVHHFKTEQLQWHFIGPIQSNKTKLLAENVDWVHSVDRLKIAHRLSEQRPKNKSPLNICVQVNVSGEATKAGLTFSELAPAVEQIARLPNVVLRGFMAIPAREDNFEKQREPFRVLSNALKELNQTYDLAMDTLSMGMSADLEAAIAEGATIVRVGTDIFGARDYPSK